jgi:hypothetical protein
MTFQVTRHCRGLIGGVARRLTSFPAAVRASRACLAVFGCATAAVAQQETPLQRVDRDHLCVTNGAVSVLAGGQLVIDAPSSRAVVQAAATDAADQAAEIRFRYLGPSPESKPLSSGELRRQIGLKLRAADSCNVIYAMWHIEPDARVAVSIKQNPAQHAHAQCGAHGYLNFKSQFDAAPIHPGEAHTLRAELHGKDLTVTVDGKIAWQGSLGQELALPFGPPGFRSDNARFAFDYFASGAPRPRAVTQQTPPPGRGPCVPSEEE